jgi:signal transduction histidine kinase
MIREKLNSEARKKDEFIATLAHELRNPLAPIRTGLEIIKRDPSGPTAIQAREMMSRQLLHMVRLIEDLLDISRISLGRLELRIEKITLKAVVDSALESSRPAIEAAMHQLAVRLPREEVYLKGDLARLSQVLSNLLINAAKYTPPGGKISLIADLDGNEIVIRVVDTGIGIPPDKLSEIFEMFSQVYSPLDRTQGGLGIGLALVRRVVQMHGGHVHGESDGLGKGSTFTVRLPASKDQV